MMATIDLPDVSSLDAKRLAQALRQLESAALWPARVAASYASDAAQPKLTWSVERNAIVTCVLDRDLQLELRPADLSMQFLEGGKPAPHVLELDDRSPAHVEAWLLVELLHRGIDRSKFSKVLPFEIGDRLSGDQEKFLVLDYPNELAAIAGWLTLAGAVFQRLAPAAPVSVAVPEVVLSVPNGPHLSGSQAERLVTFSLGDATNPEPHFSVIRATVGTVTPLRPDIVLPASQLRRQKMSAETIAEQLNGAAAQSNSS